MLRSDRDIAAATDYTGLTYSIFLYNLFRQILYRSYDNGGQVSPFIGKPIPEQGRCGSPEHGLIETAEVSNKVE